MSEERNMICIVCPMGCRLVARQEEGRIVVTGNGCARGRTYAEEELTRPLRMVTSSVPVQGGHLPFLSVKTAGPVPKAAIPQVLAALRGVRAAAPVAVGAVVLADAAGTGVDVVATRAIRRQDDVSCE